MKSSSQICLPFLYFLTISVILAFTDFVAAQKASTSLIRSVSVSKEFFNPTLRQTIQISIVLTRPGLLTLKILDRDAHVVRTLASAKATETGNAKFVWDGKRDEDAAIVPDEAYSLWISFQSGTQTENYFPANTILQEQKAELGYYDKKGALISYRLSKPCRVHLQAGVAIVDRTTKKVEGPIMATVVNRNPRASGWIVEHWDGYAESDSRIYVADLQNFKLAVAATALPENSMITVGNRKQTFLEYAAKRKGKSLLSRNINHEHHHQGLSSFEDTSPSLSLHPENAQWSEKHQAWLVSNRDLKLNGKLKGVTAGTFSKLPGHLMLFVNGREIRKIEQPCSENFEIEIPTVRLSAGTLILSANCTSAYGPAAAFSLRIRKEDSISKNSMKEQNENAN